MRSRSSLATRRVRSTRLHIEILEERTVLSTATYNYVLANSSGGTASPMGSPGPVGLTPAQIRHAYGFDAINFGSIVGDGSGQTIAIVDAYDNPKFVNSTSSSFSSSD